MQGATYSKIIETCYFGPGGLAWKSPDALSPIVVPNVAGTWDYFLFGTEINLRPWFAWVCSLFGRGSLCFSDGGQGGKGLMGSRWDSLASIYMDFFRRGDRHADNPALVWVLGAVPVARSVMSPGQEILLQEEAPKCEDFPAVERLRHGPVRLSLMEGRRVEVPADLLAAPQTKLTRMLVFERSRRIQSLRAGAWLPFRQRQHEVQLGTHDNAEAIKRGDFWYQSLDPDIEALGTSSAGVEYHTSYVIRLIRLIPHFYAQARGLVGPTFRRYRMEQVYISIGQANGCPNKVGTVFADFDCNVGYHLEWMAALDELHRRQQGGFDAEQSS